VVGHGRRACVRAFTEAPTEWLTVIPPRPATPRPQRGRRRLGIDESGPGNHAATSLPELEAMVRSKLRRIQRQPDLINAFLGQTGLSLNSRPPYTLAFQGL
jgi:hypothetical protein